MRGKTLLYSGRARIVWDQEDATYIATRSLRYPGAVDIAVEWTHEVLADVWMVALVPYRRSRMGASAFIGWSPSAGRVLVVLAYRDLDGDLHGLNAWPASGRDLATYENWRGPNDEER